MLMKNNKKMVYILAISMLWLWSGCATTNTTSEAKYLGDWEFLVRNTPNGDVSGIMTVTRENDGFNAVLKSDMGDMPIENLSIAEDKLTGSFVVQDMMLDIKGDFKGNAFSGIITMDYNEFPVEMTKK